MTLVENKIKDILQCTVAIERLNEKWFYKDIAEIVYDPELKRKVKINRKNMRATCVGYNVYVYTLCSTEAKK